MIFKEDDITQKISNIISIVHTSIKDEGFFGFQDSKTGCENFFKDLFNILYGLKLQNLNLFSVNFPSIDLGDKENKICYQITCENTPKKINETLETYNKYNINKSYPKLRIFIFDNKPRGRDNNLGEIEVLYKGDLLKHIKEKELETKEKILLLLEKCVNLPKLKIAKKSLAMQTVGKMIEFMSKNENIDIEIMRPKNWTVC